MNILENIHGHKDLVDLTESQRRALCAEIRDFLVSHISKTGGHLASNLGVVELTLAIETVFDTNKDRLVFDVGHQSYVHKLLTGRQAGFATLRQFGGISGFPKPSESISDAFVAGHASSSVSIALGMARARSLSGQDYSVITMIGDGAVTGGVAYEGLNDAAVSGEPMIIILNDNAMSIDHNVGGMASHLSRLRTKERYLGMKEKYKRVTARIPGGKQLFRVTRNMKDSLRRMLIPSTLFESIGFTYLGPVDGHDTEKLISLLRMAKEMRRPVVLHVLTKKGCGYKPAEEHPKLFHGVGKFDPSTGEVAAKSGETFSDAFGSELVTLAGENPNICAITAAMPGGTGLLGFKEKYLRRFYDVGIAEEHAVSMAGGLAKQGMVPVVAIYATFLQRAYDMIMQDVAMQHLHVVFAVDRAGLVGEDGETHHGVFDLGFLQQIPGMCVLCPASCAELRGMLRWAINDYNGPVAIRYPRGGDRNYTDSAWINPDNGVYCHRQGEDAVLITHGMLLNNAMDAAQILEKRGIRVSVVRLLCVSAEAINQVTAYTLPGKPVIIAEETCNGSGIGEKLACKISQRDAKCRISCLDLGSSFVPHGNLDVLYSHCGLNAEKIADHVEEVLKVEN